MIRRALRVSSAARPSSWFCVAAGLVPSVLFIWAFPALWRGLEDSLPWWLAQAVPPVLYGLLASVFVRRAKWPRLLGATALLWVAHLIAGVLVGAVAPSPTGAATPTGPSVPVFPQLLWVPLLLIPLHDVIVGDRRPLRASGPSRVRTRVPGGPAATPTATTETPVTPVVGLPPSPERATTRGRDLKREMSERPVTVAPTEATASRVAAKAGPRPISVTTVSEASTARPVLDEMLARDASGDVVRITFARVVDQLPAAGFTVPPDRLGDSLREPGHLFIPQRLVLAQLAEGIVRAGWETVADQFPKPLLALGDAEIAKRLRDGQLVLPLDELVPQLPPELFRSTRPLIDLQGIEEFPEPFTPAGQEPAVSAPVPLVESLPPDPVPAVASAEARRVPPPGDAFHEQSAALPTGVGVCSGVERTIPISSTGAEDESAASAVAKHPGRLDERESAAEPVGAAALPMGEPVALTSPEGDCTVGTARKPEPLPSSSHEEVVDDEWGASGPGSIETVVPALETRLLRVELPAAESVADSPVRDDRSIAAEICSLLSSAGPLNSTVDAEDGVTVLCISAPGLSTVMTAATARLMLPIMTDGSVPWPIDQLTLRGTGEALVVTPLPPTGSIGRVLMVMVPAGGSLALLETLCRRAAASHGNHARPSPGSREGNSGLLELEPTARMRRITDSFDAAVPMMTMAFRDAESVLALFLPADWDAHAVAGVASDFARAIRKGGTCAGPWQTADVVGGEHRLMLRLPDLASGCPDVITVVGGRIDRRGLAYRQLESAAQALRAG